MTGQALTATELAAVAGITKQTASAHLAKLLDAQLLAVETQGRHRYFRLAERDVAQLLESLMGVAYRVGAVRLRSGPRATARRKRSEERREGQACVSTGRSRWWTDHKKKTRQRKN